MSVQIQISDRYTRGEKRNAYEAFWKTMMPVVATVVSDSFAGGVHAMRLSPSRNEIQARVDVCKRLVDTMRQEFKWSKWRIRDTLPLALRCHLSGIHLDLNRLSRRQAW